MNRVRLLSRLALALALSVTLVGGLAGCATTSEPRPITEEEADRLSEVLYVAFQAGGASFGLNSLEANGATITMTGEIDFANHAGRAILQSTGSDAKVTQIAWLDNTILEYIPDLLTLAEQADVPSFHWVARPVDTATYTIDAKLAILRALSSDVRENPQLLQQNGVTWLRDDTLNGVDVEVFQYGDRTRFWVEKGSTTLLRFEGNNGDGSNPIVIDFSDPGARTVELPTLEDTVAVQDVAELYAAARATE